MKKLNLIAFCYLIFSFSHLLSQSIVLQHPQNGSQLDSTALPNAIKFKVKGLKPPPRDPTSNNLPRWGYLWDFGDCSYPSMKKSPVHTYASESAAYEVTLSLTPKYSGEDDELPVITSNLLIAGPYSNPSSNSSIHEFENGKNIEIVPVRDCKPGDLNTYLLPFENSGSSSILTGEIHFIYPADLLRFDTSYVNGCGYDPPHSHELSNNDRRGTLKFDISDLETEEQRFIAPNLKTKSNAQIGAEVELIALIYSDLNGTLLSGDTLLMEVVNSHDPNKKEVYKEKSCTFDSLVYTVYFENVGTGDAELVYVIDNIDEHLDLGSFHFLESSHLTEPVSIDYTTKLDHTFNPHFLENKRDGSVIVVIDAQARKIAFVFHEIYLRPKEQGHLKYSMDRDLSNPQNNYEPFGTHADIYFDDNDPVSTNAAMASTTLCYCLPQSISSQFAWINTVGLKGEINNSGDNEGYGDYRHLPITLKSDNFYPLQLEPGFPANPMSPFNLTPPLSSMAMSVYWDVRIDFDQNGIFDPMEQVYSNMSPLPILTSIQIPANANQGETTMRVAMSLNPDPLNCDSSMDGEIEDYALLIQHANLSDLNLKSISADQQVVPVGSQLNVELEVENIGPADQNLPTSLSYFFSTDPVLSSNDVWLSNKPIVPMSASSISTELQQLLIPIGDSGTTYVITVVDSINAIVENLESNNTTFLQLRVGAAKPDLLINDASSCQQTFKPGQYLQFSAEIENKGSADAFSRAIPNMLGLYLSNDQVVDTSDVFLTDFNIGTIHAAEVVDVLHSFQLPNNLQNGSYQLIAIADKGNLFMERDENNNLAFISIKIDSNAVVEIPYNTGFECGVPDAFWNFSTDDGNVSVTADSNAVEGFYQLSLQSFPIHPVVFADLKVDMTTNPSASLSFQWKDYNGLDSSNSDGIYFSSDGITFTKVYHLNGQTDEWENVLLSINALAEGNGVSLSKNFTIRFQHAGIDTIPIDGFAFDEVAIVSTHNDAARKKEREDKKETVLLNISPNPFNDMTVINYRVTAENAFVSMAIYNSVGQKILEPINRIKHDPGVYQLNFSRKDLGEGIYICSYRMNSILQSVRMVISP